MALSPEFLERVEAIRRDNKSGAAELTARAAEALASAPAEIFEAARAVVRAQPTMAPLFNVANQALLAFPQSPEAACKEFVAKMRRHAQVVTRFAAGLLQDGSVILTHSFSSTVLEALVHARLDGKRIEVICTESRPMLEGAALARRLAERGLKVRLVIDAAILEALRGATVVMVGADAVTVHGLVNKTGTALAALAAKSVKVPVYALGTSDKLLPAIYELPPEPAKDPREILGDAPPRLEVVNRYFDLTPYDCLSGIVTECGVEEPRTVRLRIREMRVHNALL